MKWKTLFAHELETLKAQHLYRALQSGEGLSFCQNDYLGLSRHPEILAAGCEALALWGAGSGGSRLLGGHGPAFEEVEAALCSFFGAPAALFFPSGFQANLALLSLLGARAEKVYSDELNHASLIDGLRAGAASDVRAIVPHRQWKKVEGPETSRRLFVTESLFSMDGDLLPLADFAESSDGSSDFRVIDEAHAVGVFGPEGRGYWVEHQPPDWAREAVTVTFGKAVGVGGAAILCDSDLRDLLINKARPFIYSTAPSPCVPAMVTRSLGILTSEAWRREELWDRAVCVRRIFAEAGICALPQGFWEQRTPIIPVPVPGEERALRFSQSMRDFGVDIRAIRFPTVARGKERLRISLSLNVSRENTEEMAREIVRKWTEFL